MSITDYQLDAMQAIFDLQEAIEEGELTIQSLTEILELSAEEGHGKIRLALAMASCAVEKAAENKET